MHHVGLRIVINNIQFELNLNLHIFESIEFNLKLLRVYGLI